jgi:pSer/pThr/pTyr-binding forkhead associated (FHA) protein
MAEHFCHRCGHRNPGGANFCSSCGAALVPEGGDLTMKISPDAAADSDVTVKLTGLSAANAALVIRRGAEGHGAGETFRLASQVTTAGRADESDIFLDDVTVSRRHAVFVQTSAGWMVKDAGSLNGTYVNKQLVTERSLENGDEVQIGKFRMVFVVGE